MNHRNYHALEKPLVGRVVALGKRLYEVSVLPPKRMQHEYVCFMLNDCRLLFKYAMRQLKGKNYVDRAYELVEEIQADAYYVHSLGGWSKKVAYSIDCLCDDILGEFPQNARVIKSTDENKSVK